MRITTWIAPILLAALPVAAQPVNYDGTWWAAPPGSESRWRLTITQQAATISASWSIRENSRSTYAVKASSTGPNAFAGPLYVNRIVRTLDRVGGDNSPAVHPVDRFQRRRDSSGTATFVFADENNGTLTYEQMSYHITRLAKEPTR